MAASGLFGGSEVDEEEEDDIPMEDGPLRKRSRFLDDAAEEEEEEEAPDWMRYKPDACTECGEPKNPSEQICHSCRLYGHKCTGLFY